jgi:hypothetical protein
MRVHQVTETEPHPHHGVVATVAQVKPEVRMQLLKVGIAAALKSGQPVRILGLRPRGDYASCSLPGCTLDSDAPQIVPPMAEVELAANGWAEPADSVRVPVRDGHFRFSMLAVGWPEAMFRDGER